MATNRWSIALIVHSITTATNFYQGLPRVRFLILGTFPAGFTSSHHGNSRVFLDGNWPPREPFPRELATTGIHGIFLYGNWPPRENFSREPGTTGNLPAGSSHHGNSRDFCKRPPRPGRWPRRCSCCWPALCLRGCVVVSLRATHGTRTLLVSLIWPCLMS